MTILQIRFTRWQLDKTTEKGNPIIARDYPEIAAWG